MTAGYTVLLDTDIGGDFDDANALAWLLADPDVDLVGITTVGAGAPAEARARVASHILATAGRTSVPVSAGIDAPGIANELLNTMPMTHKINAYTPDMETAAVSDVHAVDFLLAAALEHGSNLTLLCIGALTNVAAAFRRDPAGMRRVGEIVTMAGAFETQMREANVAIDPEAAAEVFANSVTRAVGYEVAARTVLPLSLFASAPFATPQLADLYRAMAERYAVSYETDDVVLCDVTASAAVTRPELFRFAERRVAVELGGRHTRGLTMVHRDDFFNRILNGTKISVAQSHDQDRVRDCFITDVLRLDAMTLAAPTPLTGQAP